jgi:hypothetical protein
VMDLLIKLASVIASMFVTVQGYCYVTLVYEISQYFVGITMK